MTRITRHSASAALEMLPDGVLVVRLAGPLTGEALLYFKAEIVRLELPAFGAFLVDYTRAVIALDGTELDAVLEGEMIGARVSLPAAMLVQTDELDTFLGHSVRMVNHGLIRQVFTEKPPALAWAIRHAGRLKTKSSSDRHAAPPTCPPPKSGAQAARD